MSLVEVERDGAIAVVLLNRPDALNALSDELMDELVTRLGELDRDPEVRCIVLGGSERAFAAGAEPSTNNSASGRPGTGDLSRRTASGSKWSVEIPQSSTYRFSVFGLPPRVLYPWKLR